jgi:hypothetical protein
MKYSIYSGKTVIVDNPSILHKLLFRFLNKVAFKTKFSIATSVEILEFIDTEINSNTFTKVKVGTGTYITLFRNPL